MSNGRDLIPQEIRSSTMIGKGFYVTDLFIIAGIYFVFDFFRPAVHPALQIGYTIFTVVLGVVITRPSFRNPEKRIYEALLVQLCKDKHTYHHRFEKEKVMKIKVRKDLL